MALRDWSLITGRGKFYPYERAEKVLAMLKGGGAQKVLG